MSIELANKEAATIAKRIDASVSNKKWVWKTHSSVTANSHLLPVSVRAKHVDFAALPIGAAFRAKGGVFGLKTTERSFLLPDSSKTEKSSKGMLVLPVNVDISFFAAPQPTLLPPPPTAAELKLQKAANAVKAAEAHYNSTKETLLAKAAREEALKEENKRVRKEKAESRAAKKTARLKKKAEGILAKVNKISDPQAKSAVMGAIVEKVRPAKKGAEQTVSG